MIWVYALAWRIMRKVPRRYLSEDAYDEACMWFMVRLIRHERRVHKAMGISPWVPTRGGPRPKVIVGPSNTVTGGGTITYTNP